MKKLKVLVLTDHSGHSDQNSIYALLKTMLTHESCNKIYVASRGVHLNQAFYQEMNDKVIYGTLVTEDFGYSKEGTAFTRDLVKLDPKSFDLVFMRIPRPVSDDFLRWLPMALANSIFVNHPKGIIETSNKAYLLDLAEHCPPIQLCHSNEDILDFTSKYDTVLKPLRGYGGTGVIKIIGQNVDDGNNSYPLEVFFEKHKKEIYTHGYVAMKYLKNVSQGDKRILVVDGEILAASLRMPADGQWLCNVARGGTSISSTPTSEEIQMINNIASRLKNKGILIFGADTLVNDEGERVLSEINTLSIGGFPQAEAQTQKPILQMTIDKIMQYAQHQLSTT